MAVNYLEINQLRDPQPIEEQNINNSKIALQQNSTAFKETFGDLKQNVKDEFFDEHKNQLIDNAWFNPSNNNQKYVLSMADGSTIEREIITANPGFAGVMRVGFDAPGQEGNVFLRQDGMIGGGPNVAHVAGWERLQAQTDQNTADIDTKVDRSGDHMTGMLINDIGFSIPNGSQMYGNFLGVGSGSRQGVINVYGGINQGPPVIIQAGAMNFNGGDIADNIPNNRVLYISTPTDSHEAANKIYVDRGLAQKISSAAMNTNIVTNITSAGDQNLVNLNYTNYNPTIGPSPSSTIQMPIVSSTQAGIVDSTMYKSLVQNDNDIEMLKSLISAQTVSVVTTRIAAAPPAPPATQAQLTTEFVQGGGVPAQNPNGDQPTWGDRIVDVNNQLEYIYAPVVGVPTWVIYVQNITPLAQPGFRGLVEHETDPGTIGYYTPGVGQLNGWNDIITSAASNATQFTNLNTAINNTSAGLIATSGYLNSIKQNKFDIGDRLAWNDSTSTVLNAIAFPPNNPQINLTINSSAYASFTLDQSSGANFDIVLNSSSVGLGNVANLAPNDLPVSSATSTFVANALANSVPNILAGNNITVSYSGVNAVIGTGNWLATSGGTVTGPVNFNGGNNITNLRAPVNDYEAANKIYVDTASSAALTSAVSWSNSYTTSSISTLSSSINNKLNRYVETDTSIDPDKSSTVIFNKTQTNLLTDTTITYSIPLPVVSVSYAGVVDPVAFRQFVKNTQDIADIKAGISGIARTATGNLGMSPAVADISAAFLVQYSGAPAVVGDKFINLDENETYLLTATPDVWKKIVVGDLNLATATTFGIVQSDDGDGAISYQTPGVGQVNGWDQVKADITNTSTLASNALPKAGGIITGNLQVNGVTTANNVILANGGFSIGDDCDMNNYTLNNLHDPQLPGDGANKRYVDSILTSTGVRYGTITPMNSGTLSANYFRYGMGGTNRDITGTQTSWLANKNPGDNIIFYNGDSTATVYLTYNAYVNSTSNFTTKTVAIPLGTEIRLTLVYVQSNLAVFAQESYVDLYNAQTIQGVKTFSSFPVTPSTSPSTAYQVANKQYVDNYAGNSVIRQYKYSWTYPNSGGSGVTLITLNASNYLQNTGDIAVVYVQSTDIQSGSPTMLRILNNFPNGWYLSARAVTYNGVSNTQLVSYNSYAFTTTGTQISANTGISITPVWLAVVQLV